MKIEQNYDYLNFLLFSDFFFHFILSCSLKKLDWIKAYLKMTVTWGFLPIVYQLKAMIKLAKNTKEMIHHFISKLSKHSVWKRLIWVHFLFLFLSNFYFNYFSFFVFLTQENLFLHLKAKIAFSLIFTQFKNLVWVTNRGRRLRLQMWKKAFKIEHFP